MPTSTIPLTHASVDRLILAAPEESCSTDLAAAPWTFDSVPGYGPGSSMGDVIPTGAPRQGELPAEYREAGEDELDARIRAAKQTLGDRVVVLGHFYQREEVVRHADYVGDSFQLANAALEHPAFLPLRRTRSGCRTGLPAYRADPGSQRSLLRMLWSGVRFLLRV